MVSLSQASLPAHFSTSSTSHASKQSFANLQFPERPKTHQAKLHYIPGGKNQQHRIRKNNHERWHKGIHFGSASEAACAEMMERHIPGFITRPLDTFQVPAYQPRHGTVIPIDFRVGNALIEFHPPRTWKSGRRYGDFSGHKEYKQYRTELAQANSTKEKREVKARWEAALTERYRERRQVLIEQNPHLKDCELIVVASAEQFYEKVIRRFSPAPPKKQEFLRDFERIRRGVVQRNQTVEGQRGHKPEGV